MIVRIVGLSATLALAANAILLPPGVALSEEHAGHRTKTLDVYSNGMSIPMQCFGCPFAKSEGDGMVWSTENVENSLVYQFGTGRDHDRLTLGGVQLYPPSFNEPEPIYIHQVPSEIESAEEWMDAHPDRKALQITGMEFAFNDAETISEDGNELLTMHLKVFGLADMPLPPQVLRLFVIKDSQGRLRLAAVKKLNDPHEIQAEEEQQCKAWPTLCKWKKVFADKLSGLKMPKPFSKPGKGCNKNRPAGDHVDTRPHHKHPWTRPLNKPHHDGRPRPGHHRPHHGQHPHGWHHGHHSKLHRVLHMITRVMVNIVVPILIGVAAGVATYMAGMLIGMTAALIWFKIRSVRRGQYDAVPQDEEEGSNDGFKDSKEAYHDEEVTEEVVEAPPAYEEPAEKEVVN